MNDWLDIMLEEIDRKKREHEEAKSEAERRSGVLTRRPQQAENKSD